MRLIVLLFLTSLLAAPLPALAQQAPEAEREGGATASATPEEPEQAPAEEPEDSDPFDYEASEEISEDLSVSFPVDI